MRNPKPKYMNDLQHMEKKPRDDRGLVNSILDQFPGAALIIDRQGHCMYVNKTWERMTNKQKKEFLGKTAWDIWPSDIAAKFNETDQIVLKNNQKLEKIFQILMGNQNHFWLVNKFPIRDQNGTPIMVGIVGIDITERQRREEELLKRFEGLKNRSKELRSLAAQISKTEEHKRQKLAMKIHNHLGQILTVLGLNLQIIQTRLSEEASISRLIDDSISLVGQIAEDIRGLIDELSPQGLEDWADVSTAGSSLPLESRSKNGPRANATMKK